MIGKKRPWHYHSHDKNSANVRTRKFDYKNVGPFFLLSIKGKQFLGNCSVILKTNWQHCCSGKQRLPYWFLSKLWCKSLSNSYYERKRKNWRQINHYPLNRLGRVLRAELAYIWKSHDRSKGPALTIDGSVQESVLIAFVSGIVSTFARQQRRGKWRKD